MEWYAAYLAFTLLLAGIAWYPCCGGGGGGDAECEDCLTDDDTITVTLTNITDGQFCLCEWINTAFILTRDAYVACRWVASDNSHDCTLGGGIFSVAIRADAISGAVLIWEITLFISTSGGNHEVRWEGTSDDLLDCTANVTGTFDWQSVLGHGCCWGPPTDYSGVGCEIN